MTREDFDNIRVAIRKRDELEHLYVISELEKFRKFGIYPAIPPPPIISAIMDCMIYRSDIAKDNVLSYLI